MDQVIDFSIAVCVLLLGVGIVTVANYASKFLKEKTNETYDVARNRKVSAILDLIEMNISTAISNYITDNGYATIDEKELREKAEQISETVTNLTGSGVIDFVVGTFADDWDEWIVSKVQESMVRRAQYEKK